MGFARLAPLKRGDTLSYAGQFKPPAGDWTATCQVRGTDAARTLLLSPTVVIGARDAEGRAPIALYALAADTAALPPGEHLLDVRYVDSGGMVAHSSTLILPVVDAVTTEQP